MRSSTGWRLRRRLIWAVVAAFCVAPLPAAAMAAHHAPDSGALSAHASASGLAALEGKRGRTRIRGFDSSTATVKVGRTVVDSIVVLPRARRTVLVQASAPGSSTFVTRFRGHSSANGAFRAVYAPETAGTWRFRIVVNRSKTREAATAGPRVVKAVDRTAPAPVTGLASVVTSDSATLSWVNPADQDFTGVTIRRAQGATAPATPVAGTAVTDTGANATTFKDSGLTDSTQYSYALFAHDGSANFAPVATVTLQTQRLAVTGLQTTLVGRTSVALAWTDPTDAAFTDVVIRRAVGAVAPASPGEGTDVATVPSPESTFTDTGLTPDTQYTYAVFAEDAQHVASAAKLTLTTRQVGTDALLKVNPLLGNGPRVTADATVAFDATDSLPAEGTTLVAWSVDYGDGTTPDSFTGSFVPGDLNSAHTFTNAGDRTVTLSVRDSDGATATDTVVVHVFPAPKVTLSLKTSSPQAGVPVTFGVSPDIPQGTAVTSWQMVVSGDDTFFIDGATAPPATVPVTFASGTYTVVFLLDTDAGGSATSAPIDVVVP